MGEAYKCDRCDGLKNGHPPSTIQTENSKTGIPVIGDAHIPEKEMEICPECSKSFMKWMKSREGENDE